MNPRTHIDPVANHHHDSYDIKRSSPVLYIKSAGKIGTDEPGTTNASKVGQNSFRLYSSEFMNSDT
jgi:hypothetical protein